MHNHCKASPTRCRRFGRAGCVPATNQQSRTIYCIRSRQHNQMLSLPPTNRHTMGPHIGYGSCASLAGDFTPAAVQSSNVRISGPTRTSTPYHCMVLRRMHTPYKVLTTSAGVHHPRPETYTSNAACKATRTTTMGYAGARRFFSLTRLGLAQHIYMLHQTRA